CIGSHLPAHLSATMHPGGAADDHLEHPIVRLPLVTKEFFNWLAIDRALYRNGRSLKCLGRLRAGSSDFLHLLLGLAHSLGERFQVALSSNVHEIDLRIVIEEMIVQGSHVQAVF